MTELRWQRADEPSPQGSLFDEPVFERQPGRGEFRGIEFLHVRAHRIINEVRGAPFGFRYTINAYRGCSHACTYCFARPTHTYLGLDADRDFERSIVVKVNAVSRLRRELDPRRWSGDLIAMGTNTDPYQRAEGKYRLTRGIVEVLAEAGNPFSILTKSTLVLRDLQLLAEAAQRTEVRVNLSIGTLDEDVWRATEPGTPHPARRVRAVEQLNEAGVPCGVLVAPVLPGLSDSPEQLDAVVAACVAAGARSITPVLLHLRAGVKEVYLARLAESHPHLVDDVRRRYRDRAHAPPAGQRALADLIADLVRQHAAPRSVLRGARRRAGRVAPAERMPARAARTARSATGGAGANRRWPGLRRSPSPSSRCSRSRRAPGGDEPATLRPDDGGAPSLARIGTTLGVRSGFRRLTGGNIGRMATRHGPDEPERLGADDERRAREQAEDQRLEAEERRAEAEAQADAAERRRDEAEADLDVEHRGGGAGDAVVPVAARAGRGASLVRTLGIIVILGGIISGVAGVVTWLMVRDELGDQEIVVSDDADRFAGDKVDGPFTAYEQANVIDRHAREQTDGLTYAELPMDDPRREVAMNASFLRASLYTSVVAFGVAAFAIGLGVLLILVGIGLLRIASALRDTLRV